MTKLTAEKAAPAIAAVRRLWEHSFQQAETAARLMAELALERVKLLCPEKEAFDIQRLRQSMIEAAQSRQDPIEFLRRVVKDGHLELRWMPGEPRASATLRAACKTALHEIDAGALDARPQIQAALDALSAHGPDLDALKAPGRGASGPG
jgi:hypothetical protein